MVEVATDASPSGWGALSRPQNPRSLEKKRTVIPHKHLELLAIIKAFRTFQPLITGCTVQLASDNMTALYYVNKQGGTHSLSLLYLADHLWEWCYTHHIFPVAVHVATQDNSLTEHLSRITTATHEWT